MKSQNVLFTTLGDAAGIGPELVAKTLHLELPDSVQRWIVGDRRVLDAGRELAGVTADIPTVRSVDDALRSRDRTVFLNAVDIDAAKIQPGKNAEVCGRADLALADLAADLHRAGEVHGFCFAPVNKKTLHLGGSNFEGYKAYLAHRLGLEATSAEINTLGYLWTTRVTSHIALEDVPREITRDHVRACIQYLDTEMRRFGYERPKIAVSALNPHNGDGGLFGMQEIDAIAPAVKDVREAGIDATGPFPADTIFLTVKQEKYEGVVSMYHDQCQIATKLMGFDEGVTYFGGLSLPITTPAHGTAYDIAGKGIASPTPMANALTLCARILANSQAAH